MVHHATTGELVDLATRIDTSPGQTTVVAFMRSFGCFFCWELAIQLRRDIKPALDAQGIDLIAVSIGTPERALEFVSETGFPAANLYADPDNVCYDALKLNKELKNFSQKSTPEMLMERWNKDGAKDLIGVLKRWKPWIPPKPEQG